MTCECGCGQPIIPKRHHRWRGTPKYLRGHSPASKTSVVRKGWIIKNGYRAIYVGPRTYQYEHRLVMEEALGRKLGWHEVVHHRDHNRLNNDLSNLELTDRRTHGDHHHQPGHDARSHAHKHYGCECGRSGGLSGEWREANRAQRERDLTRDERGRIRAK